MRPIVFLNIVSRVLDLAANMFHLKDMEYPRNPVDISQESWLKISATKNILDTCSDASST